MKAELRAKYTDRGRLAQVYWAHTVAADGTLRFTYKTSALMTRFDVRGEKQLHKSVAAGGTMKVSDLPGCSHGHVVEITQRGVLAQLAAGRKCPMCNPPPAPPPKRRKKRISYLKSRIKVEQFPRSIDMGFFFDPWEVLQLAAIAHRWLEPRMCSAELYGSTWFAEHVYQQLHRREVLALLPDPNESQAYEMYGKTVMPKLGWFGRSQWSLAELTFKGEVLFPARDLDPLQIMIAEKAADFLAIMPRLKSDMVRNYALLQFRPEFSEGFYEVDKLIRGAIKRLGPEKTITVVDEVVGTMMVSELEHPDFHQGALDLLRKRLATRVCVGKGRYRRSMVTGPLYLLSKILGIPVWTLLGMDRADGPQSIRHRRLRAREAPEFGRFIRPTRSSPLPF